MMKWTLCLTFALVPVLAMSPASTKRFEGEYVWTANAGSPGQLRAEFTETATETWAVAFYFTFNGQDHVYRGTAEGNLDNGSFKGEVFNENKNRRWTFEGSAKSGKLSATHSEIRGSDTTRTGTFEMTAAS